jgi:hypothetical protein
MSDKGITPPKRSRPSENRGSGDMVVARRWEYHRKGRGGCRMAGWISAVCGAPRNFLRACCTVIDCLNARSADGSIQHHALDLSTVKAAPGRRPNPRSDDGFLCVSLPIDPDSHSERLVDERNVFFTYEFFLTPSGFLLACGRRLVFRCGCGYINKTRRGRGLHQL